MWPLLLKRGSAVETAQTRSLRQPVRWPHGLWKFKGEVGQRETGAMREQSLPRRPDQLPRRLGVKRRRHASCSDGPADRRLTPADGSATSRGACSARCGGRGNFERLTFAPLSSPQATVLRFFVRDPLDVWSFGRSRPFITIFGVAVIAIFDVRQHLVASEAKRFPECSDHAGGAGFSVAIRSAAWTVTARPYVAPTDRRSWARGGGGRARRPPDRGRSRRLRPGRT